METNSLLDALKADGPHPDLAEHLMLFGQFVGSWDVTVTNFNHDDTWQEYEAEWHFGWVLEGRAVMDVWITPRRSVRGDAQPYEYGASLRFYDPDIQAWRSTWMGPVRHLVRTFTARKIGNEIVLEGSASPNLHLRWVFSEITPTSFHWRNQELADDGVTWLTVQTMVARRAQIA